MELKGPAPSRAAEAVRLTSPVRATSPYETGFRCIYDATCRKSLRLSHRERSVAPVGSPTGAGRPLGGRALGEEGELVLEVRQVVEAIVDRREAHRGDHVQLPEPLQHGAADPLAGHLVAGEAAHLVLHRGGQR